MIYNKNSAIAEVNGNVGYPEIHGYVSFEETDKGVMVTAAVHGLPYGNDCESGIFGFHIHNGTSCTGNNTDPFADANGHYNPQNCPHPYHAGDLPPLFGNKGSAYMSVITDRFTIKEIINHVVIIHRNPDDFTTQPSGNSGEKIACGKIVACESNS